MILDYVKNVGITLSGMLISMFLVTLLNYFNIIGAYFLSVLEIIISIAWIFTGGFLIGRKAKSKGYLEGIKFGLIFVILFLLISLLGIRVKFEAKSLIFYLIFKLMSLNVVGIAMVVLCALIGYSIGMLKVPNIGILKATKVVGGENVDDVIKRAIKFKQKRNKIYIYDDKEENTNDR